MIAKLALRNIFRTPRRTLITVSVISFGLASMMLVDGFILGMEDVMIRLATEPFMGHGQIHEKDYRSSGEIEAMIKQVQSVEKSLEQEESVIGYTKRVYVNSMISSGSNVTGIQLVGIEPLGEKKCSRLEAAVTAGTPLERGQRGEILLGKDLAETLEVKLGDRVVVTAAKAYSGDLAQQLYRVRGYTEFGTRSFDQSFGFVLIEDAQDLIGAEGEAHEVVLRFRDIKFANSMNSDQFTHIRDLGNEAKGWPELMPELQSMLDMSQYSVTITGLILFVLVALVLLNTIFMSLHERIFEFGVTRAIGTRASQIFLLIMTETACLGILSIIVGLAIGVAALSLLKHYGIDYSDLEIGGISFQDPIRPQFSINQFTRIPLLVFCLTLIGGIIPAFSATRITPAKALKEGK